MKDIKQIERHRMSIDGLHVVRIIFSKLIYKFIVNLIQILTDFLAELEELILKFMWKNKELRGIRTTLKIKYEGKSCSPKYQDLL